MTFNIAIQNFKEKGVLLISDHLKRCVSRKRVAQPSLSKAFSSRKSSTSSVVRFIFFLLMRRNKTRLYVEMTVPKTQCVFSFIHFIASHIEKLQILRVGFNNYF